MKGSGPREMRDAAYVPGPKKLACQNEAMVPFLPAGELALDSPWGNFICVYSIGGQGSHVPLRKARDIAVSGFLSRRFWRPQFFRPPDNDGERFLNPLEFLYDSEC
jgi:hypothetical protein